VSRTVGAKRQPTVPGQVVPGELFDRKNPTTPRATFHHYSVKREEWNLVSLAAGRVNLGLELALFHGTSVHPGSNGLSTLITKPE